VHSYYYLAGGICDKGVGVYSWLVVSTVPVLATMAAISSGNTIGILILDLFIPVSRYLQETIPTNAYNSQLYLQHLKIPFTCSHLLRLDTR
jgi:hypothetical protein